MSKSATSHEDQILATTRNEEVMDGFRRLVEEESDEWLEERLRKDRFFSEHIFGEDKIENLDEGTFRQMVRHLWAFGSWTNKDYLSDKMLESGLSSIRDSLRFLLYSKVSVAERFDRIVNEVKRMGPATVSEILSHFDPARYPIWNRRAREGLVRLGVPEDNLPSAAGIDGTQYERICDVIGQAFQTVRREDDWFEDLIEFDYLLFYLAGLDAVADGDGEEGEIEAEEDFDHDQTIEDVLELGDGLGFEVDSEVGVAPGARVDAVWRTRIANLGTISYAFEVHRRGSRDSAIVNLQKVLHQDASIRKVVLVSSQSEIERFRNEINSLEEKFRASVGYLQVSDLSIAIDHLDGLKGVLSDLGLLDQVV